MLNWEKPAFSSPFELWKEDGVLFLVLASGATMQVRDMKEVIRLIAAALSDGVVSLAQAEAIVTDP